MLKLLKVNLIIALISISLNAGEGLISLRLPIGARETALGGTGVASAQGAYASYWNPAIIAEIKKFSLSIFSYSMLIDTKLSGIFVARKFHLFNVGLGLTYFDAGKIELRGNQPEDSPKGTYSFNDISLSLTLAKKLSPEAGGGISFKYYFERLWYFEGHSFGFDLGVKFKLYNFLYSGFSISNFGSTMSLDKDLFNLPTVARIGFELPIKIERFLLTNSTELNYRFYSPSIDTTLTIREFGDICRVHSRKISLGTGIEVGWTKTLAFRVGMRFLRDPNPYSFGIGISYDNIKMNYSYSPYHRDLGGVHRIDITFF